MWSFVWRSALAVLAGYLTFRVFSAYLLSPENTTAAWAAGIGAFCACGALLARKGKG